MFYTIYKITNKINHKIYIGKHQTKDLNDGYMGSGKYLKHAIEKYGIENFEREILFQFDNEADMNAKEAELVTEEFVKKDTNYNLCPGGKGGWGYINSNSEIRNGFEKNQSNAKKYASLARLSFLQKMKNENFRKEFSISISEGLKEYFETNPGTFTGRAHTEETKEKIGKTNSDLQSGNNNSQYGTMWITDGSENKKIKKDSPIPEGWYKGRKIKSLTRGSEVFSR